MDSEEESKFLNSFTETFPESCGIICECKFDCNEDSINTACVECLSRKKKVEKYSSTVKDRIASDKRWSEASEYIGIAQQLFERNLLTKIHNL